MNPNAMPSPGPSPENGPTPPPTPEQGHFEAPQQPAINPEINRAEPGAIPNPYSPPPPGAFQPNYQPPQRPLSEPAKVPYTDTTHEVELNLPVNEDILKKRKQAKRLLAIAISFGVMFVIGIAIVSFVFLTNKAKEEDTAKQQSTDTTLKEDLNTFGLALNNFREGDDYFTITPEDVAELKTGYLPRTFNDPRTNKAYAVTNEIPQVGEIQYVPAAVCNDDDSINLSGDDTSFAIRVLLQNGTLYCLQQSEVKAAPVDQ